MTVARESTLLPAAPYRALPFLLVRSAALPARNLLGLTTARARLDSERNAVRDGIAAASASFDEALARAQRTGDWKVGDGVTLLKYLNRMSSRPAPYGLFAGVSVAPVGESTSICVGPDISPRFEPDTGWLCGWIADLQSRREVAARLSFRAHSALVIRGGRISLHAAVRCDEEGAGTARASRLAVSLLTRARDWVPYDELVRGYPDPEQLHDLINKLCELKFLRSNLQIDPGDPSPLETLARELQKIGILEAERSHISRFSQLSTPGDGTGQAHAETIRSLRSELTEVWQAADPAETLQTDGVRSISGAIGSGLADDAAALASLLLRLNPHRAVDEEFEACRSALVEKWGSEASIGLLSALDTLDAVADRPGTELPKRGLPAADSRRSRRLAELALIALKEQRPIELNADLIDQLGAPWGDASVLPATLDVCVQVAAPSMAAINAGAYTMVVAPAVGAQDAGRLSGRFGAALGECGEGLLSALGDVHRQVGEGSVVAETAYSPRDRRTMNVIARRHLCGPTLRIDPSPPGDANDDLELSDLSLQIHRGRLSLWLGICQPL